MPVLKFCLVDRVPVPQLFSFKTCQIHHFPFLSFQVASMQQGPVSSLVESLFGGDSRCALAGQVPNWGSFRQRRAVVQLDLGDGRTDVSEWAGFLRRSTFCVIAVIRSNASAAMSDLLHDVPPQPGCLFWQS